MEKQQALDEAQRRADTYRIIMAVIHEPCAPKGDGPYLVRDMEDVTGDEIVEEVVYPEKEKS
jgi:hypothetical protein